MRLIFIQSGLQEFIPPTFEEGPVIPQDVYTTSLDFDSFDKMYISKQIMGQILKFNTDNTPWSYEEIIDSPFIETPSIGSPDYDFIADFFINNTDDIRTSRYNDNSPFPIELLTYNTNGDEDGIQDQYELENTNFSDNIYNRQVCEYDDFIFLNKIVEQEWPAPPLHKIEIYDKEDGSLLSSNTIDNTILPIEPAAVVLIIVNENYIYCIVIDHNGYDDPFYLLQIDKTTFETLNYVELDSIPEGGLYNPALATKSGDIYLSYLTDYTLDPPWPDPDFSINRTDTILKYDENLNLDTSVDYTYENSLNIFGPPLGGGLLFSDIAIHENHLYALIPWMKTVYVEEEGGPPVDPEDVDSYFNFSIEFTGSLSDQNVPEFTWSQGTTPIDTPGTVTITTNQEGNDDPEEALSEYQNIKIRAGNKSTGQIKLTFDGETTGDINLETGFETNIESWELQAILESLPSIGIGNINVSGGYSEADVFEEDKYYFKVIRWSL